MSLHCRSYYIILIAFDGIQERSDASTLEEMSWNILHEYQLVASC